MMTTTSGKCLRLVSKLAVFCVVLVQASAARSADKGPGDPALERARQLASEASGMQGRLMALGPVAQLPDVLAELGARDAMALLEGLSRARLHPEAHTAVELIRARWLLDGARRAEALSIVDAQGFVRGWQIVGPFANDAMQGMDEAYAPERGVDLDQRLKGRHGEVGWRALGERSDLENIDLEALVRPIEGSVAYAAVILRAAKAQKAVLRVGSTAAYKLWVGGGLVASVEEEIGGAYDRDAWGVSLARGDNLVLMKLGNEVGPMTFNLRVTDVRGAPLKGIESVDEPEAIARLGAKMISGGDPAPGAFEVESVLEEFLAEAEALPENKRAAGLARAALVALRLRPEDPTEPHVEAMRRARQLFASREVLLIHSRIAPTQWERRDAIEQAWKGHQKDPWVCFRRAQIAYSSVGDAEYARTWGMLGALTSEHPGFVSPQAMLVGMMQDEGLSRAALAKGNGLVQRHSDHGGAVRAAWNAAQSAGEPARQIELCGLQKTLSASSITMVGPCTSLLLKAGRSAEALALVQTAVEVRPDITGFIGLLGDVQHAGGDTDAAERTFQRLTALVPGEASYWHRLGQMRLRQNDRAGALRAMKRALVISPRNTDLKAYIEHLEPREPSIEETWAISPLPSLSAEQEQADHATDDTLVLVDQKVVRVYPNGLTSTFVQRAFKIRTEVGLNKARNFQIAYTPDEEDVEVVEARVVRQDGTVRESYQVFEQSLSEPWYNLYYDYRARVLVFPDLSVGDTVEVQYRVSQIAHQNILGDYFGDMWYVQDTAPKLKARYVLLAPPGRAFQVRHPQLSHDYEEKPIERGGEKVVARSWTFARTPKVKQEESQPGSSEVADYIHVSTYASWDQIARWYWDLIKDQLVVDTEIARIVKEATDGLKDKRAKVSAIHNHVVKNTRYVGLEFGIHGYKPYRTTQCLKRRFGDCKDKASLIKVMLDEAGIPANIVLIRTRNNGAIDPAPASLQIFDHAIAYVPEFDLFLDGTAEYSGTGELPWGDQGVPVLIVKNGGGHEFRVTPVKAASTNALLSRLEVDLRRQDPTIDASTTITGAFAAGYRRKYGTSSRQKEILEQDIAGNFVGARLTHHQFSDLSDLEEPVRYSFRAEGGELVRRQGDRLSFLPTFREANLSQRLSPWSTREQILELGHPFTTQQTLVIKLPPGTALKEGPRDTELKSPFGHFALVVEAREVDGAPALEVRTTLRIDAHRVTPDNYARFRAWLGDIDRVMGTGMVVDRP